MTRLGQSLWWGGRMIATYSTGEYIVPPANCDGLILEVVGARVKVNWLPAAGKSRTTAGRLRAERRNRRQGRKP